MKKIFILLLTNFIFSASVSQSDAINVAENFFNYKNDPRESTFSIESIELFPSNFKGELTVVLSGKMKDKNIKKEISESVKIEIKKMLKKYSHKDVVEFISKKENLSKRLIYNFCLKIKKWIWKKL